MVFVMGSYSMLPDRPRQVNSDQRSRGSVLGLRPAAPLDSWGGLADNAHPIGYRL